MITLGANDVTTSTGLRCHRTHTDLQHARGVEKTTKRRQTMLKSTVQRQKTIKTEETIK